MNWNCEMCRWNVNGYGEKLADKWRIHNYCYRNGCQYEPFVAKTCNQTCNKLQDVATNGGAKMVNGDD